ncbi:MAG: ion transporter [Oscillatoriales cyanobacterium SM2_2_1]|nr:ion transporter [Oscillatoriales cyanobacterium SM2_2_1]
MAWRSQLGFYLDDFETAIGRAINGAIAVLVLGSSAIFVAQTYPLPDLVRSRLNQIDNLILYLFFGEYLLRWWCATNRWNFLFSLYGMIDLVAIFPVFLGSFDVRFIRLMRWFRILRLARFFGSYQNSDTAIVLRILFTVAAIVFIFSGLIYQVEHHHNPLVFQTFLDAFYYSIFTMTTVGYGSVVPTSNAGKLTSVLMVLTGVALIPVQLGELFRRFLQSSNSKTLVCTRCGLANHEVDALFCRHCGTGLPLVQNITRG